MRSGRTAPSEWPASPATDEQKVAHPDSAAAAPGPTIAPMADPTFEPLSRIGYSATRWPDLKLPADSVLARIVEQHR